MIPIVLMYRRSSEWESNFRRMGRPMGAPNVSACDTHTSAAQIFRVSDLPTDAVFLLFMFMPNTVCMLENERLPMSLPTLEAFGERLVHDGYRTIQ